MSPEPLSPLAQSIAAELQETTPEPMIQIERAINLCGADLVQTVLTETRAAEAQGGLLVPDGSRRRTMGGVFFHLLREKMERTQWQQIHIPSHKRIHADPILWDERLEAFRAAMALPGEATAARILVAGRPSDVKQREGFIIATIAGGGFEWPALSHDLPAVSDDMPTTYKVCIANKHWRKVSSLLRNPQDKLIAEGYAVPNPQQPMVVVFALRVTTYLQQKVVKTRQSLRGLI